MKVLNTDLELIKRRDGWFLKNHRFDKKSVMELESWQYEILKQVIEEFER